MRTGDLADRAFERAASALTQRERPWTQELVYGTLRLRGRLDHVLDSLVKQGTHRLDADVLEVLRLGAYQLLEMGSVPAYAAISQSVEIARAAGAGRAAGLVSGVLHALAREPHAANFPQFEQDPVAFLSTWGSHPRWLLERWIGRWGPEATRRLVELNNQRPDLFLHPVGPDAAKARERLHAAGIGTEPVAGHDRALRLLRAASAAQALETVAAIVQDPAAQLVVDYAAPESGMQVLDLCAAPGGKAIALADRGAQVTAADVSARRLQRVHDNVRRLGWEDRVRTVVADARQPPVSDADLVLVDAPCTGTGTLRRHPDARWRISPPDLVSLGQLQQEILAAAALRVRPGGWLVYSTCSLEPEENEVQIERFLAAHPEFGADPAPGAVPDSVLSGHGWLEIFPQRTGSDGAFAARLRRRQ